MDKNRRYIQQKLENVNVNRSFVASDLEVHYADK